MPQYYFILFILATPVLPSFCVFSWVDWRSVLPSAVIPCCQLFMAMRQHHVNFEAWAKNSLCVSEEGMEKKEKKKYWAVSNEEWKTIIGQIGGKVEDYLWDYCISMGLPFTVFDTVHIQFWVL